MVGIAMVGNDDYLVIAHALCSLNGIVQTGVEGLDSLLNCGIYTGVAHHIAIGEVHDDEIIFIALDCVNELVFHFKGAHLGLEVVGGDFGRGNENTVFAIERSFASAVKEECHMRVLLSLGDMELLLAQVGKIFSKSVVDVFLVEKDVHALERRIVRSHAVILQAGDGVHAFFGHVMLGENNGEFLCAVVAVVEENHHVAFLDGAIEIGVVDGLDELVGHIVVIALLHGGDHIGGLLALAFNEKVVGNLDAVPAFVTVHCIIAADY